MNNYKIVIEKSKNVSKRGEHAQVATKKVKPRFLNKNDKFYIYVDKNRVKIKKDQYYFLIKESILVKYTVFIDEGYYNNVSTIKIIIKPNNIVF